MLEVLGHVGEVVGRGLHVDAFAFEVLYLRFHSCPFRVGRGWDVVEEDRDLGVRFVVVDVEGVVLDFGDDFVGRVEDGGLFVFGLVDFVDDFVDGLCEELFVGFFFIQFLAEVGEVGFEVLFDFDFVAHEVAVEVDAGFGEVVVGVVVGFECVEVELFFVEVHVLVENGGLFFFDFEEELFEFGDFVEVLELFGVLFDFEDPFEAGGVEALCDFGEALAAECASVFEGVGDVPVVEFFDLVLLGLLFFELVLRLVAGEEGGDGVEGSGVGFLLLFRLEDQVLV